jgi:hypothetical protein
VVITADNITNEQIRELCLDSCEHDVIANIALRGVDGFMTAEDVRIARARCAELLNARNSTKTDAALQRLRQEGLL